MFVCLNLIQLFLVRNIFAKIFYQHFQLKINFVAIFDQKVSCMKISEEEFNLILHVIVG